MNMNTTIENTQRLAHEAAQSTGDMIRSTRHNAENAVGKLDDKVQQLRHRSRQLQAKANYAAHETQQYVRDQPVKSVLIAAGVGVLLMGLVSLFARQGSRD